MFLSNTVVDVLLFCVPLCWTEDLSMFSTKSPYVFKSQTVLNYPNYEPKKVWAVLRHGTRLPSKKVISRYNGLIDLRDDMLNNSKQLNDRQRAAFKRWKPMDIKLEHQKFLTKQGESEHFQLGSRFRKRFPSLFDGKSSFSFRHTPTQRTELSAKKFIEGLFPGKDTRHQSSVVERDDPILRPYKGCPLWRTTVKKNKEVSLKEHQAFEASESVENVVNEIRYFTQVDHLAISDLEHIYTMCGFESSWEHQLFNGQSVWCSLFQTENQLKIMEYLEDLEYYWVDGYGFEITRKVACKTVEDLLNQLDPSVDEKTLSFYFTHSGTILKLLTFLDLYKDEFELTADNFRDDRLWKTSLIDTFSSNLIFVLYESQEHGPHIQLLHQEQVINIPKCQMNEHGMCAYEAFRNLYTSKIKNCNLTELCRVKDEL